MAIQRVEQLRTKQEHAVSLIDESRQKRLELHTLSSFERLDGVTFPDGSRIVLPQMRAEEQAIVERVFGGVSPAEREKMSAATDGFVVAISDELRTNAAGLSSGGISPTLRVQAATTFENYMVGGGEKNRDDATTGFMYASLGTMETELQTFARGVAGRQELASDKRTEVMELQEMISNWPEGSTQTFRYTETRIENGVVVQHEVEVHLTKDQAQDLLKNLNIQLDGLRELTEMDKFDLQKKYELYQQGLSLVSNVLKEMHDTYKAIINNVKAS